MQRSRYGRKTSAWRDAFWLIVLGLVIAWSTFVVISSIVDQDSGKFGLKLILPIVVGLIPMYWVGMGAWRRTRRGQRRLSEARRSSD